MACIVLDSIWFKKTIFSHKKWLANSKKFNKFGIKLIFTHDFFSYLDKKKDAPQFLYLKIG